MYILRFWKPVFMAVALALLVALGIGNQTLADDFDCNGSLGVIQVDNLRVPDHATCTLNGTIVSGNVLVQNDATLHAYAVHVDGNIQADNAARVNVYAGSFVGASIQIIRSGAADIQAVDIDGNLYLGENVQFLNAANNTIQGDLQAFQNSGGVSINGNTIANNLQCTANNPPPTGSGNIVGGNMEDQCANFGEVPTPVPTDTPAPTSTSLPATDTPLPTDTPTAATNTPPPPPSTPLPPTHTPQVDKESPTVQWIAPVSAGERYDLSEGEQIYLIVEANDNIKIAQVRFLRWDSFAEQYVTLKNLSAPPYQIAISANTLNPGWNQVFAFATDPAGNRSGIPYIWLYKLAKGKMEHQLYMPFASK